MTQKKMFRKRSVGSLGVLLLPLVRFDVIVACCYVRAMTSGACSGFWEAWRRQVGQGRGLPDRPRVERARCWTHLKNRGRVLKKKVSQFGLHSSGAVRESRWTSWAVRPNEPSGFRGRKDLLNRASALVTTCP